MLILAQKAQQNLIMLKEKVINTIYLIGGIVFVKLFCSSNKRNKINKTIIKPKLPTKTPLPTKNKWLYTNDSFGKMEKGVVYYSETL